MDRLLVMNSPIRRKASGGGGPATEDLRPTSTVGSNGTVTGGATAHGVLADGSDSTYIQATSAQVGTSYGQPVYGGNAGWRGGISGLTLDAGRNVAMAVFVVRGLTTDASVGGSGFSTEPGFLVGESDFVLTSSRSTVISSPPLTKSGGGTWTKAEFDAIEWQLALADFAAPSAGLIYELDSLIVRATFV